MKILPRSRSGSTERYPLVTIAAYGPDGTHASKLVVSVIEGPGPRDSTATRAWTTQAVDVRHDPVIADDVASFVQGHGAKQTVTADRIIGCPHEEGIERLADIRLIEGRPRDGGKHQVRPGASHLDSGDLTCP